MQQFRDCFVMPVDGQQSHVRVVAVLTHGKTLTGLQDVSGVRCELSQVDGLGITTGPRRVTVRGDLALMVVVKLLDANREYFTEGGA